MGIVAELEGARIKSKKGTSHSSNIEPSAARTHQRMPPPPGLPLRASDADQLRLCVCTVA